MAKKAAKKAGVPKTGGATVSGKIGSYEKHPFFVKKKQDAKTFLKKVGLPESLVKKTAN